MIKKIVFITTYPLSEPVVKNRLTPFIDVALDSGLEVTLISPAGGCYARQSLNNFNHITVSSPPGSPVFFITRAAKEIVLCLKIVQKIPSNTDVVFVTIPSMFLLFAYKFKCPTRVEVLDVRDLTWEYLSERSFALRCFKRGFRYLAAYRIAKFDLVSVTNEHEKNYVLSLDKISEHNVLMCTNGISKIQYHALEKAVNVSQSRHKKRPVVAYIGNVGVAQNITTFVTAAKQLPGIDFKIIGGGNELNNIKTLSKNMPNFQVLGRVSWDRIPSYYANADLLWAQLTPDFSGAMPSKLYEYITAGKPIVYGGEGQALSVLKRFVGIQVIESADVEVLVSSILYGLDRGISNIEVLHNREIIVSDYIRETSVLKTFEMVLNKSQP